MDERGQIQELFEACVDLSTSERERYLLEHCPSDALRARVHRMLNLHDDTDGEFGIPASDKFRELLNAPGESIGDFEIIREAGRGGMSLVYLARDTVLDREVALKVLGADRSLSETSKQRFLHEARAAAGLNHPNIIKIFRYGETDRHGFIAMEYIPNGTFDRWLAERDKETNEGRREIVRAIESIAEALESAHRAGVIHRDVKPTNILMDGQGRPYLADFGIARVTESIDARETLAGAGTAAYMSPEQIAAVREEIDHRSDIFSLGVVLYEALVGQLPFKGRNGEEIKDSIRKTDPAKPRSIIRSLPRDLEVICGKAMEKNPNDRYPSAGHMAADLRAWADGKPILARPRGLASRSGAALKSRRKFIINISAGGAAAYLGANVYKLAYNNTSEIKPRVNISKFPSQTQFYAKNINDTTMHPSRSKYKISPSNGILTLDAGHYRIIGEFGTKKYEYERYLVPGTNCELTPPNNDYASDPTSLAQIASGNQADIRDDSPPWHVEFFQLIREVEPFTIDRYEVKCADYSAFLLQRPEIDSPPHWGGRTPPPGWEDLPATGVSYEEAQSYSEWIGMRLPTAPEWELAARGLSGWFVPWTPPDEPDYKRSEAALYLASLVRPEPNQNTITSGGKPMASISLWNHPVDNDAHRALVERSLRSVYDDRRIDRTRHLQTILNDNEPTNPTRGIVNMFGNAMEFTESLVLPGTPDRRRIFGNHANMTEQAVSLPMYSSQSIRPDNPNSRKMGTGFRCARSHH